MTYDLRLLARMTSMDRLWPAMDSNVDNKVLALLCPRFDLIGCNTA